MPLIENTYYNPPFIYRNAHLQTMLPTLLRRVSSFIYTRVRIETPDEDFIDLDISGAGKSSSAVILCHGLEGSSDRHYMRGMVRAFNAHGIDAICYNYRGCSGEMNRNLRMYNAGSTDDLDTVVSHVRENSGYRKLYLAGFSLGANLVLRYAGENGDALDPSIKGIVAVSAPCDLKSSAVEIHRTRNYLYHKRFLIMLLAKMREKAKSHPELSRIDLESIKTLGDFDNLLTAPIHGYRDAEDYWQRASCRPILHRITVPSLIMNALDDPIFGNDCYPFNEAEQSEYVFLETPARGGHVGFMRYPGDHEYWHETRALEFIREHCA